jgi:hypothetical protein
MKILALFLAVMMLSACDSSTPSVARGPNGHRTFFVTASDKSTAFNRAATLCRHGYSIVRNPGRTKSGGYAMDVECKPSS